MQGNRNNILRSMGKTSDSQTSGGDLNKTFSYYSNLPNKTSESVLRTRKEERETAPTNIIAPVRLSNYGFDNNSPSNL